MVRETPSAQAVTAVVPLHNASRTIVATLRSLLQGEAAPEEIVCVDDASTDSSREEVHRFASGRGTPVRILQLPSRCGPAAARNRGAEAARTPLVLFVDSDVVLLPNTLGTLLERHAAQGRGAVVSVYRVRSAHGDVLSDFATFYSAFTHGSCRGSQACHFSTQCVLVSRDDVLRVGGFDERFRLPTVEDIELGFRLTDAGIPVTVAPDAQVIHDSRLAPGRFLGNYLRKGFDFGWVLRHRRMRGLCGAGYGGLDDLASLALLGMLGFSALLSGWLPPGTSTVLLVALLAHWRSFIRASSRMGPLRGLLFIVLRALVLMLSASAAFAGFLAAGDRPGPWHARGRSDSTDPPR